MSGGEYSVIGDQFSRENHLLCEERTPFAGSGVVGGGAADEFMPAIGFSDESGGAEERDDFIRRGHEPERFFIFIPTA